MSCLVGLDGSRRVWEGREWMYRFLCRSDHGRYEGMSLSFRIKRSWFQRSAGRLSSLSVHNGKVRNGLFTLRDASFCVQVSRLNWGVQCLAQAATRDLLFMSSQVSRFYRWVVQTAQNGKARSQSCSTWFIVSVRSPGSGGFSAPSEMTHCFRSREGLKVQQVMYLSRKSTQLLLCVICILFNKAKTHWGS